MEAIVFMLVGAVVAVYLISTHRRGVRFVRSYYYLFCLEEGCSVEEANRQAAFLLSRDDSTDSRIPVQSAKEYAAEFHSGRQAAVIYEAQRKGFVG